MQRLSRIIRWAVVAALLAGNVYAIEIDTSSIRKIEDKSFLDVFSEDEQCIILAFEHQLNLFAQFYAYYYKGECISTPPQVSLFDVASLYWSVRPMCLDEFLDYICAAAVGKTTNIELNIEAFKNKVKNDYAFIKKQRKEKDKEKEFFMLLYKFYEKILDSPQGRRYYEEIKKKLDY